MHTSVTPHSSAAQLAAAGTADALVIVTLTTATSVLYSRTPAMEKIAKVISKLTWTARRKLASTFIENLGNCSTNLNERLQTLRYLSLVVNVLGASEIRSVKDSVDSLFLSDEDIRDIRQACAFLLLVCVEHAISEDLRVISLWLAGQGSKVRSLSAVV